MSTSRQSGVPFSEGKAKPVRVPVTRAFCESGAPRVPEPRDRHEIARRFRAEHYETKLAWH